MAVGKVRIDLEANVAKFEKQIQSFSKKLDLRVGQLTKSFKVLTVATTAASVALGLMVRTTINANDQLAKTADKIGTTTEELSKLHFAAELTGVSSNTMNMALQRMTRRLSEASLGTGEAVKALDELGINAQQIVSLPLSEQLDLISNRMQTLRNQSDRVRIAMKLFDSEGVALVNTLKGGSDALDEYRKKAEELGIVVDTKTAKASEKFNDKLTILGKVTDGFVMKLTAKLLPTLETITDKIIEFSTSQAFQDTLNTIKFIIDGLVIAFNGIVAAIELSSAVIRSLAGDLDGADKQAKKFLKSFDEIKKGLKNLGSNGIAFAGVSAKTPGNTPANNDDEVKKSYDKYKTFKSQIKDFYTSITDYNTQFASAFKNSFNGLEDALVSFVQNGKLNFKDLANSIISDLLRITIRQAIIAPLVGSFSSFMGGTSLAGARALGGPVTGNSSYLVGERGPEIFTPSGSGRITSNNAISNLSGSSSNVILNIENNTSQGIEAEMISQLTKQNSRGEEEKVINIVMKNINTNSNFRNTLKGLK